MHTDASSTRLGAIFSEETLQGERPIYYLSRKQTPTECKYVVIEKKALAIRWAIDQLKYYLWGQEFTVTIAMVSQDEGYQPETYAMVSVPTTLPIYHQVSKGVRTL